jgi:hypothetical protein
VACTVLHRIAFPVVSEWYQKRRSCVTIVLARSMHPKEVQHLDGHRSMQLTIVLLLALDTEYDQDTPTGWMRPWGSDAAYRRCKASQETCVIRSKATVAVKHSRSRISIQHHNM